MFLLISGDNQFRLSDLRLEPFDLCLGFRENVAPGGVAGFELFDQAAILGDLPAMPHDFIVSLHELHPEHDLHG